jgi:hypothetical protein
LSFVHNKRNSAVISYFALVFFNRLHQALKKNIFSCFGGAFTLLSALIAPRAARLALADLVDDHAMVVNNVFLY